MLFISNITLTQKFRMYFLRDNRNQNSSVQKSYLRSSHCHWNKGTHHRWALKPGILGLRIKIYLHQSGGKQFWFTVLVYLNKPLFIITGQVLKKSWLSGEILLPEMKCNRPKFLFYTKLLWSLWRNVKEYVSHFKESHFLNLQSLRVPD